MKIFKHCPFCQTGYTYVYRPDKVTSDKNCCAAGFIQFKSRDSADPTELGMYGFNYEQYRIVTSYNENWTRIYRFNEVTKTIEGEPLLVMDRYVQIDFSQLHLLKDKIRIWLTFQ